MTNISQEEFQAYQRLMEASNAFQELAARREVAEDMARAEGKFDSRCEIVRGDVLEPETLGPAMEGVDPAPLVVALTLIAYSAASATWPVAMARSACSEKLPRSRLPATAPR